MDPVVLNNVRQMEPSEYKTKHTICIQYAYTAVVQNGADTQKDGRVHIVDELHRCCCCCCWVVDSSMVASQQKRGNGQIATVLPARI